MIEPFPENLSTIPACFECNNGYSNDEEYVSCFLDVLKEAVFPNYMRKESTLHRLERNISLRSLIEEQIQLSDRAVHYSFDEKRLCRILKKLATGHAGFEMDYISFGDDEALIAYDFIFNMSEEDVTNFEEVPEMSLFPEVGSRSCATPYIVQNVDTGEASTFMFWNDVQEGQYRYQVSYNEHGGICVKIVIYEFLYCRVDFN